MKQQELVTEIYTLIVKSIKDELTEDEAVQLMQWRQEDKQNEETYIRLTTSYSISDHQRYLDTYRLDGWQAIMAKSGRPKRSRRTLLKRIAAAAVIICAGISSYIIVDGLSDKAAETTAAGQPVHIKPGVERATLILPSGEQINVDADTPADLDALAAHGLYKEGTAVVNEGDAEMPVETHTWSVPRGGEFSLTLSDGTSVWLNSESKIIYPSRFGNGERHIAVEGEAYFEVAKDERHPFVVDVCGVQISVTGTEFNVAAYDGKVETTLITGGVVMCAGGREVALAPGRQAVYSDTTGDLSVHDVDASVYAAWKDGIFEFNDMELAEIVKKLGRWYDVDFVFERRDIARAHFTGAFKRSDSITFILDVIKNTKSVNYSIDGNTITLR